MYKYSFTLPFVIKFRPSRTLHQHHDAPSAIILVTSLATPKSGYCIENSAIFGCVTNKNQKMIIERNQTTHFYRNEFSQNPIVYPWSGVLR